MLLHVRDARKRVPPSFDIHRGGEAVYSSVSPAEGPIDLRCSTFCETLSRGYNASLVQ
jgi:hypothetical protein